MHTDHPDLTCLPGTDIVAGVRAGTLATEDVVAAFLARADAIDPAIGSYVTLDRAGAMAAARAIPARLAAGEDLPLAGLPVTIKDQFLTRGLRTTGGSRVFDDFVPDMDAPVVARLRAAGAVILGKTVTPEFGLFWRAGAQVGPETRNPWDLTRTSGGSSAGAAAGVAARLAPVAIGSDGAGSIRLPAAFCGVAGLMPTLGRVPRTGSLDGARLFTQVGPIARNVSDLALVMAVIAGASPDDPLSLTCPPLGTDAVSQPGLRIALWDDPGAMAPDHDPRVVDCVRSAFARLDSAGHRLTRLERPIDTDAILPHFRVISGSDRLALLGRDIMADPARAARLGPYVRQAWDAAARTAATDYALALAHRDSFVRDLADLFRDIDVIVSPTAGTVAPAVPDDPVWRPPGYFAYTFVANYSGFPGLTVPCGMVDGLPVGIHFLGPPGSELRLMALGQQAETILGVLGPPPGIAT